MKAIEIENLTRDYGDLRAVDHITFSVEPGEIFGFLGPNGAGKTTTIRMLTGLLQPTEGTARVAGFDILQEPLQVKARLGYLSEEPFLYPKLTGREFLRFVGGLYRVDGGRLEERIHRLLDLFDLEDVGNELIESYSHGMRQKVALCSLLVHQPQVLFLDEPTTGLDPKSARLAKEVLRGLVNKDAAVFMSTHILEIAQTMCDRVGIIDRGRLIALGTLGEIREQARAQGESLEDVFLELTGGSEVAELAAYLAQVE
jgi:ABC-2 type transport system ATP-binding protein